MKNFFVNFNFKDENIGISYKSEDSLNEKIAELAKTYKAGDHVMAIAVIMGKLGVETWCCLPIANIKVGDF